jgi:hypothetical protein
MEMADIIPIDLQLFPLDFVWYTNSDRVLSTDNGKASFQVAASGVAITDLLIKKYRVCALGSGTTLNRIVSVWYTTHQ